MKYKTEALIHNRYNMTVQDNCITHQAPEKLSQWILRPATETYIQEQTEQAEREKIRQSNISIICYKILKNKNIWERGKKQRHLSEISLMFQKPHLE